MQLPRRETDILEMTVDQQLLLIRSDAIDVYCLNPVAAAVYHACDGDRDAAALAALLAGRIAAGDFADDYHEDEAEAIVGHTLARLGRASLVLAERESERRHFLIGAGRAAAFAALVTSTMLPAASAHASGPIPGEYPCVGVLHHAHLFHGDACGVDEPVSSYGCCSSSSCVNAVCEERPAQ